MLGQARSRRNDRLILDGQRCIDALIACLHDLNVKPTIDAPADPNGEWWVDLSLGDFSTNVAWRSSRGFGIFTSDKDAYGDRPDETYREPEQAAKRIRQLAARSREDNKAMHLGELRKLLDIPQTWIARHLKRDQAFISRLERQDDALLSTVRAYVEALGGEVRLVVRFDGFEASVSLPTKGEPGSVASSGRKTTKSRSEGKGFVRAES